jgi:hypothetical protein
VVLTVVANVQHALFLALWRSAASLLLLLLLLLLLVQA